MVIEASAPVRICDNGGWTDTWFGGPGRVVNIAVTPGVEVSIRRRMARTRWCSTWRPSVTDTPSSRGRPGSPATHSWRPPSTRSHHHGPRGGDQCSFRCSGGLRHWYVGGGRGCLCSAGWQPCRGATLAARHRLCSTSARSRSSRARSGIQDQLSAAFGGINYLEIESYPEATVYPLPTWGSSASGSRWSSWVAPTTPRPCTARSSRMCGCRGQGCSRGSRSGGRGSRRCRCPGPRRVRSGDDRRTPRRSGPCIRGLWGRRTTGDRACGGARRDRVEDQWGRGRWRLSHDPERHQENKEAFERRVTGVGHALSRAPHSNQRRGARGPGCPLARCATNSASPTTEAPISPSHSTSATTSSPRFGAHSVGSFGNVATVGTCCAASNESRWSQSVRRAPTLSTRTVQLSPFARTRRLLSELGYQSESRFRRGR